MLLTYPVLVVIAALTVCVELKPSINTEENEVEVTIVREQLAEPGKREVEELPDSLKVNLRVRGKDVQLRMRKTQVNVDAPVFFVDERGEMKQAKIPNVKNLGLYQDLDSGAAISVTAKSSGGRTVRTLQGNFEADGEQYDISPESADTARKMAGPSSQSLEADQGIRHKVKKTTKTEKNPTDTIHDDYKKIPDLIFKETTGTKITPPVTDGNSKDTEEIPEIKARKLKELKEATDRQSMNHTRTKRQATFEAYHVETTFLVDHTLWEYWLEEASNDVSEAGVLMKKYLSHQMNGIDLAYKSIDVATHGIMISVWLHNYIVATTEAASTWTATSISSQGSSYPDTNLDGDAVLEKLGVWSTEGGRSWSNPDHTMLWTRYGLFDGGTIGYAYLGGVCQYSLGVSVVKDTGYHSWSTAAHELGHSLGADHDGDSNNCIANDMYIMTATSSLLSNSTIDNAYTFSTCSISSMIDLTQGVTDGYPRVCLTDKTCEHSVSLEGLDVLPGETYSTQEQCEIKRGPQAQFCDFPDEDICLTLWCSTPTSGGNCLGTSPGAADGTTCATGMWCRSGKCVSKADNPAPSPSNTNNGCTSTDLPSAIPAGCTSDRDYSLQVTDANGNAVATYSCADLPVLAPQYCFTASTAKTRCCADCTAAGLVTPTQHVETPGDDTTNWYPDNSALPLASNHRLYGLIAIIAIYTNSIQVKLSQ